MGQVHQRSGLFLHAGCQGIEEVGNAADRDVAQFPGRSLAGRDGILHVQPAGNRKHLGQKLPGGGIFVLQRALRVARGAPFAGNQDRLNSHCR